ncbi:YcxB family protein [Massilia sp. Dwa41.01b]|uniref:YcxB family protein n=1 Tax=unclassified Massilia TaxID=2609279 RepID=UPI0016020F61|nr:MULTISPECIES: YcxB family protein [unclassified Massilia]QNA88025.1 YcxB family protein [Massilia sp. Dwa41.01b]QNA98927.1 YcxB family protein [Massilia sp. Se16.2.3]
MPLETTLIYSESLIRQATFAYWRRTVGVFFVPVLLALTACFLVLLMQRDLSWITGMIGTVIGFGYLISASLYVVHYRNSLAKFRRFKDAMVTFHADNNSFTMKSSAGTSTLHWAAVKEVWKFEDVWLLLFSKAQFSTLPVANLSPELRQLIVGSVESAGGKVL